MPHSASFYPPTPTSVPADLTRLDRAYRTRVAAMIGGLFTFLVLYLLLISASVLLVYIVLVELKDGCVGLVLAPLACLFCIFLLKGLFKGRRVPRDALVPISESEYPELFAFIRRVYQDTGSRRPRGVYVSADVNAGLIYQTSLLNLFFPPRKDLLIGLGLVNVVDLVEFKAILAHEFGHFAQRSTRLGSYLYVANQVMGDVIYGRDALDRFVDTWASNDIRISFPAWGLKAALWSVRGILSGMYRGLNLLHLSMSRQMEFNADNVAVSVAGSDAVIHGLVRTEFATDCLADAARSLDAAADHGMFTDDLFHHQTRAAERLRTQRKDDRLGLPPDLPDDPPTQIQVFPPIDDGIPDKYRTHPTNHMREINAKRYYIRSPRDDRSPWLLFGDAAGLKQKVSGNFYRYSLNRLEPYHPKPAAEVQEFINAEHAEMTYDPKYHGWYDDRYINPGELRLLPADVWPDDRISTWLKDWPAADLGDWLKALRQKQQDLQTLHGLGSGQLHLKGPTFEMCNRRYGPPDVPHLIEYFERQLKLDAEDSDRVDREVFLAHWSIGRLLDQAPGDSRQDELLARYRFHLAIQGLLQGMITEQQRLGAILGFITRNPQMHPDHFVAVRQSLDEIRKSVFDNLEDAKKFTTPALANVPTGYSLFDIIVDRGDRNLAPLYGDTITSDWIMKLMARLDGVVSRIRRLHFKSLGNLLTFQEKLAVDWNNKSTTAVNEPKAQ